MNKIQISEAVWTVLHIIGLERKSESETIKLSVARPSVQCEHFYIISLHPLKSLLKVGVGVGQCEYILNQQDAEYFTKMMTITTPAMILMITWPHSAQMKGLSPVWILMCAVNSCDWRNDLPQIYNTQRIQLTLCYCKLIVSDFFFND